MMAIPRTPREGDGARRSPVRRPAPRPAAPGAPPSRPVPPPDGYRGPAGRHRGIARSHPSAGLSAPAGHPDPVRHGVRLAGQAAPPGTARKVSPISTAPDPDARRHRPGRPPSPTRRRPPGRSDLKLPPGSCTPTSRPALAPRPTRSRRSLPAPWLARGPAGGATGSASPAPRPSRRPTRGGQGGRPRPGPPAGPSWALPPPAGRGPPCRRQRPGRGPGPPPVVLLGR